MHVQMRNIDRIRPHENNPRFNDVAVDAVAKSIQEFGLRQPIVVNENKVIIVGHTRFIGSGKPIDKRRVPSWKGKGTLWGKFNASPWPAPCEVPGDAESRFESPCVTPP